MHFILSFSSFQAGKVLPPPGDRILTVPPLSGHSGTERGSVTRSTPEYRGTLALFLRVCCHAVLRVTDPRSAEGGVARRRCWWHRQDVLPTGCHLVSQSETRIRGEKKEINAEAQRRRGGLISFPVHKSTLNSRRRVPPHPGPMASQARHETVSPQETNASRFVVPWGEGASQPVTGGCGALGIMQCQTGNDINSEQSRPTVGCTQGRLLWNFVRNVFSAAPPRRRAAALKFYRLIPAQS